MLIAKPYDKKNKKIINGNSYIKSSVVIGILSKKKDYLRTGCVNNQLMGDKPIAPRLFVAILFLIGFFIYRFLYIKINRIN